MQYRKEIDGLRAVAVLPVILFHAGFSFFSGGFVGVDIFFVISGYLITTILIEEMDKGDFHIVSFYERRVRRILPALYFVIVCCVPIAWILMSPEQMAQFTRSIMAVILFGSNILFWKESGYFTAAAEEKPLLHTWSLAVEEQYYVFFPLLLFVFWRFGKERVFWLVAVLTVGSLSVSEFGWRYSSNANFYLLPSRAWELFVGSLAAFVVAKRGVIKNDALAIVGLLSIVFSIFFFDSSTPFPSLYTLVPVLGTFLIIISAESSTSVARLLGIQPIVMIGLISYSAYLWHQPLMAFARVYFFEHPSSAVMFSLALLSLVLAWLSWRFVEAPFRNKKAYSKRRIFTLAAIASSTLLGFGFLGHLSDGFKHARFTDAEVRVFDSSKPNPMRDECHFPRNANYINRKPCQYFSNNTRVALLGNSHGTELAYALALDLKASDIGLQHHTMSECRHNYEIKDELQTVCQRWHAEVLQKLIANRDIEAVILSYRHESYIDDPIYRDSLVNMANAFVRADKTVVLVLQAPLLKKSVEKYILADDAWLEQSNARILLSEWRQSYQAPKLLKGRLDSSVVLIDPADTFCPDNDECRAVLGQNALYFDNNHMSLGGAGLISKQIYQIIMQRHVKAL